MCSSDLKLFPISHKINTIGCQNYTLIYEVTKLKYFGQTDYDIGNSHDFGNNMTIEWQKGNYYERLYKYKNRDEGKLTIKYKPSENFTISVRLFDPIISESSVFTKLISNKAGLTSGTAIFVINNPVDNLSSSDLLFTNYVSKGNSIISDEFFVQKTKHIKVKKYKKYIIEKQFTEIDNKTGLNVTKKINNTVKLADGFKYITKKSWEKTNIIPKGINVIKYEAKWKAHTGQHKIDWFANVNLDANKYNLPKNAYGRVNSIFLKSHRWAWWNNTFFYKKQIDFTANVGQFSYLETIPYSAKIGRAHV